MKRHSRLIHWMLILMVFLAMLMVSMTASAETSGTCGDNLTWTLDDNGVLTISRESEMR